MSILSYNFSMQGESHKKRNMVCQDSSLIYFKGGWKMAVAGDGVGSCRCSDAASRIAAESLCKLIDAAFPVNAGDEDILALIRTAMNYAANSIDRYVFKNGGEPEEYHTTLTAALYNGKDVYYANSGDSGIVILDTEGNYRLLTHQQNNEYGEVITLARRRFEIGKADCSAAAVICMTDGLLDWCSPLSLSKHKYPLHVPRLGLLVPPEIWLGEEEPTEETVSLHSRRVQEILSGFAERALTDDHIDETYGDLSERNLCDDLTAAVMVNPDVLLESIKWEAPRERTVLEKYADSYDYYKTIYPSIAKKMLTEQISMGNPDMSEEELNSYIDAVINTAEGSEAPAAEAAPQEAAEQEVPTAVVAAEAESTAANEEPAKKAAAPADKPKKQNLSSGSPKGEQKEQPSIIKKLESGFKKRLSDRKTQ